LQKGENTMQLSAPKQITWWVALALVVIGIIAQLVTIPVLSGLAFWIVVVAAVLLLVATFIPNL
jgi:heme/copper-type cytochrome/quinol oxidase subunit 1